MLLATGAHTHFSWMLQATLKKKTMTKICLYCKKEKSDEEFSQEHILPRGVGGNLNTYNPFSINDVCQKCNNLSGLFIDGPFIKSWFINNYRADIAKKYCHLTDQTILPLTYFGEIEDLKFENKICEFWLGPTGDTIYHFHEPYPEELDSPPMVGVPPTAYKKEIDYGFVFLFIRSNNPQWHPAIVLSVMANFKKSILYLGNGNKPSIDQFKEIPDELSDLHLKLKDVQGQTHKNSVKIGINSADRFLCKLALGIGSLLLDESFKESKSADLLRLGMWTKNRSEREKLPIHGTGLLGNKDSMANFDNLFKWSGGHAIVVMATRDRLALYSNFYEVNSSVIQISDEPELWKDKLTEGVVYVVVPPLSKAVGPIKLTEFIAHRIEFDYKNEQLLSLEEQMQQFTKLPPFDI